MNFSPGFRTKTLNSKCWLNVDPGLHFFFFSVRHLDKEIVDEKVEQFEEGKNTSSEEQPETSAEVT